MKYFTAPSIPVTDKKLLLTKAKKPIKYIYCYKITKNNMSEVPRTQEDLIDPEDQSAPIELDDKDILAVEPATPKRKADQQRPLQPTAQPGVEDLQGLFRSIRGKLSGVGSMDTAHDDNHELNFTGGENLVESMEPDGRVVTLDEVEKRAKLKIFGDARAKREAAKTPEQIAATERVIKGLRRPGGQPPVTSYPGPKPPIRPISPTSPRPSGRKDRLIERLKGLQ